MKTYKKFIEEASLSYKNNFNPTKTSYDSEPTRSKKQKSPTSRSRSMETKTIPQPFVDTGSVSGFSTDGN